MTDIYVSSNFMTSVFHSQFITKRVSLLILIFFVTVSRLFAQTDNADYESVYNDSILFQSLQLNFNTLDSNKIKAIIPQINIHKTDIICYRDSFWADTVRLAYSTNNKNKWISFATPFHNNVIPYECNLVNIDNKGQPEIVVKGTIVYEGWPRGEFHKEAIIIYQIDSGPRQIFIMLNRCYEFGTADYQGKGGYDYVVERKVNIENGEMVIEELNTENLDQEEKEWLKGRTDCQFSVIPAGTYKLINGQFKRL